MNNSNRIFDIFRRITCLGMALVSILAWFTFGSKLYHLSTELGLSAPLTTYLPFLLLAINLILAFIPTPKKHLSQIANVLLSVFCIFATLALLSFSVIGTVYQIPSQL